jgi:hypothetical protein
MTPPARLHRTACIRRGTIVLAMTTLVGCVPAGRPIGIPLRHQTQFQSEWKGYLNLPGEKSLAVAGHLDGVYASGHAQGAASTDSAVRDALARCEQRRIDRHIPAECETYAIGNQKVTPVH